MSDKTNPFATRYYNESELQEFGFKAIGKNVRIASNCKIVGLENISIGDNVIIDAFCSIIVSEGYLEIGSFVHISAFCHILANEGVEFKDFSGLSQGVKVYSKSDDHSGNSLCNPAVPDTYKNLKKGKVIFNEFAVVGSGSVVLPNVNIGSGASVGAMSLVTSNLKSWTMFVGNPLRKLGKRSDKMLELKEQYFKDMKENPDAHVWKH